MNINDSYICCTDFKVVKCPMHVYLVFMDMKYSSIFFFLFSLIRH